MGWRPELAELIASCDSLFAEVIAENISTAAPEGFDANDLEAASQSLLRKRARAVTTAWPALAYALGTGFTHAFSRFAREQAPPAVGEGLADGFAFAT